MPARRRSAFFVRLASFVSLAALLLVAGTAMTTVVRATPAPAVALRAPARFPAGDPVRADSGMVVSASRLASEAGRAMLERGGNAVDAAVATGFALAVVYPRAGNLGGGGFMVIRRADGTVTTIDHREKAPLGASKDMYLDEDGNYVQKRSRRGYLASGVPGTVAGLLMALKRYGTLSRAEVMAPALRMAEAGFRLSRSQAERLNGFYTEFARFPASKRYFTKGDSTHRYRAGERFVQEDLAQVLERIEQQGRAGFYQGPTADAIVKEMERGDGLIDHEDLTDYEAVERAPVRGTYRGYQFYSMGPPSSGGVALAQLLNAVEPYPIGKMGYASSATVHLMGEAMRRVYADRAKWLGDSDFVNVPVEALIQKSYMKQRMKSFDPDRASRSDTLEHGRPLAHESMETTHYSVVDNDGAAVSVTTTLNSSYGSKVAVGGAGFFLNNEMDDFVAKPGVPNQYGLVGGKANAIAPEKRMLSSMSPTIVEDAEGRLFMVIGTPGGSTIITTVFQIMLNVIDHGMNIQEAISAGRVHHQWLPDQLWYEPYALARDAIRNLEARGWDVRPGPYPSWGSAQGITVHYPDAAQSGHDERYLLGASDPRREGAALGY